MAKRVNGPRHPESQQDDPLRIMRHVTYALRPLSRDQRRMVLETLLEISE